MFRIAPIVMLVIFIQGCVDLPAYNIDLNEMSKQMYNVPSSGTSQFDGTKHIRVSNMVCSNEIMFRLYQDTSKAKNGIVLLEAGSKSITNIGNNKSLLIKLDGKTYSFKSNDLLTEHGTIDLAYGVKMQFSHKTFIVPETFVREAATSKVFLSKIHLLNNTYIEGKCSTVTLQEMKEQSLKTGFTGEITQEHVDLGNRNVAISGFREFVRLMDAIAW